jgi:hypothetical protein
MMTLVVKFIAEKLPSKLVNNGSTVVAWDVLVVVVDVEVTVLLSLLLELHDVVLVCEVLEESVLRVEVVEEEVE